MKIISKVLIGSLTAQAMALTYHEFVLPADPQHQPHIEHNHTSTLPGYFGAAQIVVASTAAPELSIATWLDYSA